MDGILLMIGVGGGLALGLLDALLFALVLHPGAPETHGVVQAWKAKRYFTAITGARATLRLPLRFIHRSLKFLAAFLVVAAFVLTSTDSRFSQGLILGFALSSLGFALRKVRSGQAEAVLFWDLDVSVPIEQRRRLVVVYMFLLSLLVTLSVV